MEDVSRERRYEEKLPSSETHSVPEDQELSDDFEADRLAPIKAGSDETTSPEERIKLLEAELQSQYDQVQEYYSLAQQYEIKWKSTTKELLKQRQAESSLLNTSTVDDDLLVQSWNHIRYLIRTFAHKYFKVTRSFITAMPRADTLKYLTPEFKRYSKTNGLRAALIQAHLFKRLLSHRDGARLLWAGEHAESFRDLAAAMQPTRNIRQVPQLLKDEAISTADVASSENWRATTAGMLAARADQSDVDGRVGRLVTQLALEIQPLATARDGRFCDDLREVVVRIVELDEMVYRSRAIILFQMYYSDNTMGQRVPYQFEFGGEEMESEDGFEAAKPGMVVELVITPGLHKIGTGEGTGYETMSRLCKATVICSAVRESMEKSGRLK
jgi:hypothetical protein